jgi:hypothetical protein
MLKSTLIAGSLALLMLNLSPASSEPNRVAVNLEPALSGSVSASGLFPTQEMEDAFAAYLEWTKSEGLSRLTAFEITEETLARAAAGEGSLSGRFPTQAMEDQFKAYLAWVDETDVGLFYAFRTTNFD